MEQQKYRLNLTFPNIYREVELMDGAEEATVIGTTRNCNVRLAREAFFREFEFTLSPSGEGCWDLLCSESCYISQNDVLKLHRLTLQHGDSFVVCYQDSNAEFCRGEFLCDFDSQQSVYSCYISLNGRSSLSIGGAAHCELALRDPAVGAGYVQLSREGDHWRLQDCGTRYGISVNGTRHTSAQPVYDYDFFALSGHSFYLYQDRLYFCSDPLLDCRGIAVYEHRDSATQLVYPHFNRSTRIYYELPDETFQIQNPPNKKDPPRQNLMMTILPTVVMLLLTVLLRGVMGGGGAFILISACSMAIGIVTSVLNYRREKKEALQGEQARVAGYTAYMQNKEAEIAQERQQEMQLLEENIPCMEQTLQTVWRFDHRLYERTPSDPDFLTVRLGTGTRDSVCPVHINVQEFKTVDDPLMDWPEQVEKKYRTLAQTPAVLEMKDLETVGLIGPAQQLYETVKLMTIDLCVRHSYLDLQLCYLLPPADAQRWSWVRWLRHVNNGQAGVRNIACSADSCKVFVERLYKELSERENSSRSQEGTAITPHYVVFVLDIYDLMQHPISRFFSQGKCHGVTFVFCSSAPELLPKCQRLVTLEGAQGRMLESCRGNTVESFALANVSDEQASRVAVKLASVTVDEVNLASQLTKNISLFRMLRIFSADDLDLQARWASSQVYKSMAAPLGVNTNGDLVCLDLHEKAHGPHGLVAGTTGSGKSEVLQSYILSMASQFHPYDVSFVIIDFKGGGMVNQFRELPHLIGSITDIDGREINRSLLSIRAELNKRKELFAQAGVNHIDQYIKKFKNKELQTPLPHLILIVDEFAELKAEQPDFMKELISAARVGRSLGVHLILATQKPAGVVDAQIWSNSRFRLCLKVATPEDSKELLKTPLAAEIREPGRAYLQVGNNEIFELFQSAYSGAAADSEIATGQRSYHIDQVELSGLRRVLYKTAPKTSSNTAKTQLQEMVSLFRSYCDSHHIDRLPGICLPPLPSVLPCPDQPKKQQGTQTMVSLGIYDDPSHQSQNEYLLSLGASHVLIAGAAMSGKTCMLQQMIRSLCDQYTPRELNLYIVDFASRAMGIFDGLNHVSGCVFNDQEDRLKILMRLLLGEVRSRKERFSSTGITSFSGYREANPSEPMPQIVVLIDNFLAFRELYPQYDDDLLFLLREGASVGVCLVVTVQQSNGIGFRYLSAFGTRIALHCNDTGEYSNLLDRCRIQPKNTPGRAVVCIDKECYEMQTYLAFAGEQEIERVQSIRCYKQQVLEQYGQLRAARIPEIPETMDRAWLADNDPLAATLPAYTIPIGMDYDTVEFVRLDFARTPLLSISGAEGSGRTNVVNLILESLQQRVLTQPSQCYILDSYDRKLACKQRYGVVKQYTSDASDLVELLEEMQLIAEERQAWMRENDLEQLQEAPLVLLILRHPEVYEADKKLEEPFKNLLKLCRGLKMAILLCGVENAAVTFSSNWMMKTVKENRSMIFTDRLDNMKIYDLSPTVVRGFKSTPRAGDGFWLDSAGIKRIKIAQATQ